MKRVAVVTPSITSGDAVSNDVTGMHEVLERHGFETKIFAEGWTTIAQEIFPVSHISSFLKNPEDVLIYHYSRGWDLGLDLLRNLNCRTVVRYHNVTPPEFFVRYSADLASMCLAGREQIGPIARADCDRYLSASAYNMRELVTAGAPGSASFVVPPFHQIDRLQALESDQNVLQTYADGKINICMVGRLSPNKGHPALIEGFAAYHHDYNSNSRLLIVGKEEDRLRPYSALLREIVKHLKVRDAVLFTGEVSEAALKAYYQSSHAFMITSEHEGFCVPLVEAMALGVPIVGYSSSAIPETVDEAGLIWEDRNPYLLAESINSIANDKSVSKALIMNGWCRYQKLFTNERIEHQFMNALEELL